MGSSASTSGTGFGPRTPEFVRSWRGPVLVSILGPVGWLVFTLLYVGFWAGGLTLFQDVIVVLVSLLLLAGTMGAAWIVWGSRRFRMFRS